MPPILAAIAVLAAASAKGAAPAPIQVVPKPAPPSLTATLGAFGFSTPLRPLQSFTPLQGLPPTGDTGPQCRADCVKSRAICGTDDDCGDEWRQCVAACAVQVR
jgi:hypothetical protein